MSPYQITGIIAGCSLCLAGVVALLAMQGVPVMVAFLLVYAVALLSMVGMQRRARQSCEDPGDDVRDVRRRETPRVEPARPRRGAALERHPALAGAEPPGVAAEDVRF